MPSALLAQFKDFATVNSLRGLGRLPDGAGRSLGKALGQALWLSQSDFRSTTEINIKQCFADKSPRWQQRLARQSLIETAITSLEIARIWQQPTAKSLTKIKAVRGNELIDQALDQGRGVIILAPHLGNWELLGIYLAEHYPITNLYQPVTSPGINALIKTARQRQNAKLAPTNRRGIAQLVAALRRGELTGILPDQVPDPGYGAEYAPFFGTPALTSTLIPKLARQTDAAIVIGVCLRQKDHHRILFQSLPQAITQEDISDALRLMNQGIEAIILQAPEQYQWEYKRFKRLPAGMGNLYNPERG